MGRARVEMVKWWHERDRDALEWLVEHGAQYSATRDLKNAVAAFGEYLVWREFGGTRNPQASGLGDVNPAHRRRTIEVKTTSSPTNGWNLGYRPMRLDYALLRIDITAWRVVEAWLVPLPVAQRHASGDRFRMSAHGPWRRERHVKRLNLVRF